MSHSHHYKIATPRHGARAQPGRCWCGERKSFVASFDHAQVKRGANAKMCTRCKKPKTRVQQFFRFDGVKKRWLDICKECETNAEGAVIV